MKCKEGEERRECAAEFFQGLLKDSSVGDKVKSTENSVKRGEKIKKEKEEEVERKKAEEKKKNEVVNKEEKKTETEKKEETKPKKNKYTKGGSSFIQLLSSSSGWDNSKVIDVTQPSNEGTSYDPKKARKLEPTAKIPRVIMQAAMDHMFISAGRVRTGNEVWNFIRWIINKKEGGGEEHFLVKAYDSFLEFVKLRKFGHKNWSVRGHSREIGNNSKPWVYSRSSCKEYSGGAWGKNCGVEKWNKKEYVPQQNQLYTDQFPVADEVIPMLYDIRLHKIPVTILSGSLGAGKTTILTNIILKQTRGKIMVIQNEIGKKSVDTELVNEQMREGSQAQVDVKDGCVCCTNSGTFEDLMLKFIQAPGVASSKGPTVTTSMDALVIELSGAARPDTVKEKIEQGNIKRRMQLDGVITLVDVNSASQYLPEVGIYSKESRGDIPIDGPSKEMILAQKASNDYDLMVERNAIFGDELYPLPNWNEWGGKKWGKDDGNNSLEPNKGYTRWPENFEFKGSVADKKKENMQKQKVYLNSICEKVSLNCNTAEGKKKFKEYVNIAVGWLEPSIHLSWKDNYSKKNQDLATKLLEEVIEGVYKGNGSLPVAEKKKVVKDSDVIEVEDNLLRTNFLKNQEKKNLYKNTVEKMTNFYGDLNGYRIPVAVLSKRQRELLATSLDLHIKGYNKKNDKLDEVSIKLEGGDLVDIPVGDLFGSERLGTFETQLRTADRVILSRTWKKLKGDLEYEHKAYQQKINTDTLWKKWKLKASEVSLAGERLQMLKSLSQVIRNRYLDIVERDEDGKLLHPDTSGWSKSGKGNGKSDEYNVSEIDYEKRVVPLFWYPLSDKEFKDELEKEEIYTEEEKKKREELAENAAKEFLDMIFDTKLHLDREDLLENKVIKTVEEIKSEKKWKKYERKMNKKGWLWNEYKKDWEKDPNYKGRYTGSSSKGNGKGGNNNYGYCPPCNSNKPMNKKNICSAYRPKGQCGDPNCTTDHGASMLQLTSTNPSNTIQRLTKCSKKVSFVNNEINSFLQMVPELQPPPSDMPGMPDMSTIQKMTRRDRSSQSATDNSSPNNSGSVEAPPSGFGIAARLPKNKHLIKGTCKSACCAGKPKAKARDESGTSERNQDTAGAPTHEEKSTAENTADKGIKNIDREGNDSDTRKAPNVQNVLPPPPLSGEEPTAASPLDITDITTQDATSATLVTRDPSTPIRSSSTPGPTRRDVLIPEQLHITASQLPSASHTGPTTHTIPSASHTEPTTHTIPSAFHTGSGGSTDFPLGTHLGIPLIPGPGVKHNVRNRRSRTRRTTLPADGDAANLEARQKSPPANDPLSENSDTNIEKPICSLCRKEDCESPGLCTPTSPTSPHSPTSPVPSEDEEQPPSPKVSPPPGPGLDNLLPPDTQNLLPPGTQTPISPRVILPPGQQNPPRVIPPPGQQNPPRVIPPPGQIENCEDDDDSDCGGCDDPDCEDHDCQNHDCQDSACKDPDCQDPDCIDTGCCDDPYCKDNGGCGGNQYGRNQWRHDLHDRHYKPDWEIDSESSEDSDWDDDDDYYNTNRGSMTFADDLHNHKPGCGCPAHSGVKTNTNSPRNNSYHKLQKSNKWWKDPKSGEWYKKDKTGKWNKKDYNGGKEQQKVVNKNVGHTIGTKKFPWEPEEGTFVYYHIFIETVFKPLIILGDAKLVRRFKGGVIIFKGAGEKNATIIEILDNAPKETNGEIALDAVWFHGTFGLASTKPAAESVIDGFKTAMQVIDTPIDNQLFFKSCYASSGKLPDFTIGERYKRRPKDGVNDKNPLDSEDGDKKGKDGANDKNPLDSEDGDKKGPKDGANDKNPLDDDGEKEKKGEEEKKHGNLRGSNSM